MHWIGKFLLWWLTVCTDFWMDVAKLNDTNVLVTSYLIKGPVIFTLHLVWNVNSNILPLSLLLRNIQSNCPQLNGRAVDFITVCTKIRGILMTTILVLSWVIGVRKIMLFLDLPLQNYYWFVDGLQQMVVMLILSTQRMTITDLLFLQSPKTSHIIH